MVQTRLCRATIGSVPAERFLPQTMRDGRSYAGHDRATGRWHSEMRFRASSAVGLRLRRLGTIEARGDQDGGAFLRCIGRAEGRQDVVPRAMLADGLVDELHLFVYPVALGAGERLFAEGDPAATFALAQAEGYDSGVVHLGYHAAN